MATRHLSYRCGVGVAGECEGILANGARDLVRDVLRGDGYEWEGVYGFRRGWGLALVGLLLGGEGDPVEVEEVGGPDGDARLTRGAGLAGGQRESEEDVYRGYRGRLGIVGGLLRRLSVGLSVRGDVRLRCRWGSGGRRGLNEGVRNDEVYGDEEVMVVAM
ncbi:hypothetical protein BC938DRAFT_480535 [Jimgerdemannia flammicorona]|uniref:Uncharacterized protein n=1 Tax=Jimgerdemannia flammicorona TaxID=994334 RepID=A0A433QIH6_9FUNG|nr:hypothetical protein BC938DRAFT_480535 [Jimgerdemannia flammicorona]